MAAGDVSAQNIRAAKDHKHSAEALLIEWRYKHGASDANRKFDQLKLIVGNECREVYDQVFSEDDSFGQKMLIEIRNRLRNRITREPNLFFGCTYEHLLGIAGILTEMCEVWWSQEFEIPSEVSP